MIETVESTPPRPSDAQSPSARALPSPRRPLPTAGSRPARHRRWVRIATWTTVAGVAVFVGYLVWLLVVAGSKPSVGDAKVADCRRGLAEIATYVNRFADRRGRLPDTLADLKDWEDPAPIEAAPWDPWAKPIEYRVVDAPKREFRLRSPGPDKTPDTADDIVWPAGKAWKDPGIGK